MSIVAKAAKLGITRALVQQVNVLRWSRSFDDTLTKRLLSA